MPCGLILKLIGLWRLHGEEGEDHEVWKLDKLRQATEKIGGVMVASPVTEVSRYDAMN